MCRAPKDFLGKLQMADGEDREVQDLSLPTLGVEVQG